MAAIERIEVLAPEALSAQVGEGSTAQTCRALNGRAQIRFHEPSSVDNGDLPTWKRFELHLDGVRRPLALSDDLSDREVMDLPFHYPLAPDSSFLALPLVQEQPFQESVVVVDLDDLTIVHRLDDLKIEGLVWSPSSTELAISRREGLTLVGRSGSIKTMDWASERGNFRWAFNPPFWTHFCAWTPSGNVLALPDRTEGTNQVVLYNAKTLERLEAVNMDPSDLLPYDEEAFRIESAGRTLSYPFGDFDPHFGAESAMDERLPNWLDAIYNPGSATVSLSTFRPTGETGESPDAAGLNLVPPFMRESAKFMTSRIGKQISSMESRVIYKAWVRFTLTD